MCCPAELGPCRCGCSAQQGVARVLPWRGPSKRPACCACKLDLPLAGASSCCRAGCAGAARGVCTPAGPGGPHHRRSAGARQGGAAAAARRGRASSREGLRQQHSSAWGGLPAWGACKQHARLTARRCAARIGAAGRQGAAALGTSQSGCLRCTHRILVLHHLRRTTRSGCGRSWRWPARAAGPAKRGWLRRMKRWRSCSELGAVLPLVLGWLHGRCQCSGSECCCGMLLQHMHC